MRRLLSLLIMAMLVCSPLASAQSFGQRQAEVSLISERDVAQAGETFFVAFDIKINPNWHVYWRNAGDSGLPPEIFWSEDGNPGAGDFVWPAPHEQVVLEDQIVNYGFEERLVLPFAVSVPADAEIGDPVRLKGVLEYQICEQVCLIETEEFDRIILIGQTPRINEQNGQLIAEWASKAPVALSGQARFIGQADDASWTLSLAAPELASRFEHVRFFPYENEIKHSGAQVASFGDKGLSLTLIPGYKPEIGETIDGVIVVESSGVEQAFEVSAPIGSEPLAGTFGGGANQGVGASAGMNILTIAFFALLGGLVLNLMPCVLPVLSIKAIGMVQAVSTEDAGHLRAHGIWYTLGVVLSFLAIAGAFLGLRSAGELVSLGFQLQYPVVVSVLVLIMFVIGLWLLGVIELGTSLQNVGDGLASKQGNTGAFFTGVLAAVVGAPCVGPLMEAAVGVVLSEPPAIVLFVFFLIGLGLALPFLLLSFAPGLHRFIPKPGAWMERLKQFFAFPMFLTAAWLLSVLGQLAGIPAIMWTVVGAVLLSLGIWALSHSGGKLKLFATVFGVVMLLGGVGLPIQASLAGTPAQAGTTQTYSEAYESVAWSSETVSQALDEGRGVFVDFTASWCVTCQLNKRTTLKQASVQKAFADNNVTFMVADYTARDDAITAEIRKHNRPGVPMYLYYAPGSRTPEVLPQLLTPGLIMDTLKAS